MSRLRLIVVKYPFLQPPCLLANLQRREPFQRIHEFIAKISLFQ